MSQEANLEFLTRVKKESESSREFLLTLKDLANKAGYDGEAHERIVLGTFRAKLANQMASSTTPSLP